MKATYVGFGWLILLLGTVLLAANLNLLTSFEFVDLTFELVSGTFKRAEIQLLFFLFTGILLLIIGLSSLFYGIFSKERTRRNFLA